MVFYPLQPSCLVIKERVNVAVPVCDAGERNTIRMRPGGRTVEDVLHPAAVKEDVSVRMQGVSGLPLQLTEHAERWGEAGIGRRGVDVLVEVASPDRRAPVHEFTQVDVVVVVPVVPHRTEV